MTLEDLDKGVQPAFGFVIAELLALVKPLELFCHLGLLLPGEIDDGGLVSKQIELGHQRGELSPGARPSAGSTAPTLGQAAFTAF